jgi:hypothetical protein
MQDLAGTPQSTGEARLFPSPLCSGASLRLSVESSSSLNRRPFATGRTNAARYARTDRAERAPLAPRPVWAGLVASGPEQASRAATVTRSRPRFRPDRFRS